MQILIRHLISCLLVFVLYISRTLVRIEFPVVLIIMARLPTVLALSAILLLGVTSVAFNSLLFLFSQLLPLFHFHEVCVRSIKLYLHLFLQEDLDNTIIHSYCYGNPTGLIPHEGGTARQKSNANYPGKDQNPCKKDNQIM